MLASVVRPAPLSSDYRQSPLWWDDTPWPQLPEGPPPPEADVVVIGAGYTGLAAAWELRRRGREVVVVDQGRLGNGASSRNAGMAHAGLRPDLATLERRYGALGWRLRRVTDEAFAHLATLAEAVAPDCHYVRCGWIYLAHRRGCVDRLRREAVVRAERFGEQVRLLVGNDMIEETVTRTMHAALVTDDGAAVHPARLLAGLARSALAAGATIHEHVHVDGVERDGAALLVRTSQSAIRARDVLVATNGYTDAAFPYLRRRILPIGSYIIATEPLDAQAAATITSRNRLLSDTRNFLHYWRLSPDRRLVFGGRTSFAPITLERARDRLYHDLVRFYPHLAGIRVTHSWWGLVDLTFDRIPHLGRRDGVTFALGYCGSGVAMATWFGRRVAGWLCGDPPPAFAEVGFPTVPFYRGRPWFLPLVGWYYQLRDRFW